VTEPLVSFIVPTRDRPRFLHWCLRSIAAQTDGDFEVVVADNPTTDPVADVVAQLDDDRFRYEPAPQPVSMCANWERAVELARGAYVAALTDKMAVVPSTVRAIRETADAGAPDVVSWWNAAYRPLDEDRDLGPGYFVPAPARAVPSEYSLPGVIQEWLAFRVPMQRLGRDALRGKIVFGAFKRDLLDRMRDKTGKVFHPIAPDYTSMGAACVLGRRAVDLGRAQAISFESTVSNGKKYAADPLHAHRFLMETDPSGQLLDALPIPGLYASIHNLVAHDIISAARLAGGSDLVERALDREQLAARAAGDLALARWRGAEGRRERTAQRSLLDAWCEEHGVEKHAATSVGRGRTVTLRRTLAAVPPVERALYRALGRAPERHGDIVQAAAANDR